MKKNHSLFITIIIIGLLGILSIYITEKKQINTKTEKIVKQVKESKGYQLLYIGAKGCEPCEFQESQLETLISHYDFSFYYLDLEGLSKNKISDVLLELGAKTGEFSTPSLMVYKDGEFVEMLSGLSHINEIFDFFKKNKIISEDSKLKANYLNLEQYMELIESPEPQVIALGSAADLKSNYAQIELWEITDQININFLQLSSLSEKEGIAFENSLEFFSQAEVDIPMLLIVQNKQVIASTLENLDKEGYIDFLKENNML